jgi:hypothetical protein
MTQTNASRIEGPGAVVRKAYLAANRGRYADANRYVAPGVLRSLTKTRRSLERTSKTIRRHLPKMQNARRREQLAAMLDGGDVFQDPYFCWKATTRNRCIMSVEVLTERIQGKRATVAVALRLKTGEIVEERERLVRTASGWRIG